MLSKKSKHKFLMVGMIKMGHRKLDIALFSLWINTSKELAFENYLNLGAMKNNKSKLHLIKNKEGN